MTKRNTSSNENDGRLGFVDALTQIFRRRENQVLDPRPEAQGDPLEPLATEFATAVEEMQTRIETLREPSTRRRADGRASTDRESERKARLEAIHARIRSDIEHMHARLGSGLEAGGLDEIVEGLEELEAISTEGRDAHELIPRARHAIAEKLRVEAGELAVERLRALLGRAQILWPDPIRPEPGASTEEIERSRRRRLAETREVFLSQGFARSAARAVGIVAGWGADYPEPGSPLWEESVLEGVAAGIRGRLILEFVELLRRDRDALVMGFESVVGTEVAGLQERLAAGVTSISDANRAVASALQAIDTVTPQIAWTHLAERLPRARGEWNE